MNVKNLRKYTVLTFFTLSLLLPTLGLCNIWKITHDALVQSKSKITYEQAVDYIQLLTSSENVVYDQSHPGTVVIAGGYIVINPTSIRSFNSPEAHLADDVEPEYTYEFEKTDVLAEQESKNDSDCDGSKNKLKGISIALDIIPAPSDHIDHAPLRQAIGTMKYEEFVAVLQESLANSLKKNGAEIHLLRPVIELNGPNFDKINKNPPHIVISTQFNTQKQDCMVTFCSGNILQSEFTSERQRARFIHSLISKKHIFSAQLGACMTKNCQDQLQVNPLSWEKAFFEKGPVKNARPVSSDAVTIKSKIQSAAVLEEHKGHFDGIATRNLIQNGLFAKAFVVPFPDIQWVRSQVQPGQEIEWINKYVNALTDSVVSFVDKENSIR